MFDSTVFTPYPDQVRNAWIRDNSTGDPSQTDQYKYGREFDAFMERSRSMWVDSAYDYAMELALGTVRRAQHIRGRYGRDFWEQWINWPFSRQTAWLENNHNLAVSGNSRTVRDVHIVLINLLEYESIEPTSEPVAYTCGV